MTGLAGVWRAALRFLLNNLNVQAAQRTLMAERSEQHEPADGNKASFHRITYTLRNSGVSIDLYTRDAYPHDIRLTLSGLYHRGLPRDMGGYVGEGTKDPRLMPLVKQFEKDLQQALDLDQKPLTKGFLRKKPVTVTVNPLCHTNADALLICFLVKDGENTWGLQRQTKKLYERLAEAVDRLVPAFEQAADAAMAQPLPERNLRGESFVDELERRREEAIADVNLSRGLADTIERQHQLPHHVAAAIASTALDYLRGRGLLMPRSGGREARGN